MPRQHFHLKKRGVAPSFHICPSHSGSCSFVESNEYSTILRRGESQEQKEERKKWEEGREERGDMREERGERREER